VARAVTRPAATHRLQRRVQARRRAVLLPAHRHRPCLAFPWPFASCANLPPRQNCWGHGHRRRSRTPTTAPASRRQHDRGDNAESDDNNSGHEIEIHTLKPAHVGRHDRSHGQKIRSNGKSENGCHLEANPAQTRSHAHVHRRRGKRADPSTPHRQSASLQLRIGSASTGARVSSRTGVGQPPKIRSSLVLSPALLGRAATRPA
jgi:hypothetical protein